MFRQSGVVLIRELIKCLQTADEFLRESCRGWQLPVAIAENTASRELQTVTSPSPQAVFLEHESWLRTVVRSRLSEPEAVEDVMQNIAMAIVRQRQALQQINRIGGWLYQIAVRQVLMYRRATGRRRRMHGRLAGNGVLSEEVTSTPVQHVIAAETQENVQRALEELPELDRQILMLKYSENWSYRQLAEHLGIQEDTVEYRLMKARRNLKRVLVRYGEEGTP